MNLETADLKVSSVNLLLLRERTATGLSFKNKLQKAVKSSKIANVFFEVFASNFIRFHRNKSHLTRQASAQSLKVVVTLFSQCTVQ